MTLDPRKVRSSLRALLLFLAIGALFLVAVLFRFSRLTLPDHARSFCELPASDRFDAMRLVVDTRFITIDDGSQQLRDARTGFVCGFDQLIRLSRACKPVEVESHPGGPDFQASLTSLCNIHILITKDRRGIRVEAIMGEDFFRSSGRLLFQEIVRARELAIGSRGKTSQ